MIAAIVDELVPELIKRKAVGYECASQLLITAGDNPERLHSESGFAALCGVNPVPASSGKNQRLEEVIVQRTARFISSPLADYVQMPKHRNMSPGELEKAIQNGKPYVA